MRKSLIPSVKVELQTVKRDIETVCVGCGNSVRPGFCRTGSIIVGPAFHNIKGYTYSPVIGTVEFKEPIIKTVIIGGETLETNKRVGFLKREKGFLCDDCAGIFRCITDRNGNKIPIVKVDPLPGTIKTKQDRLSIPAYEHIQPESKLKRKSLIPSL